MTRYVIRRLLWALVMFWTVTVVSFVIFYIIPVDPAKQACGQACTQEDVVRVAKFLGTDRPVYVQYGKFVGRLMPISFTDGPHFKTPSLGNSFYNRQPVNKLVLEAAPVTASLVFGAAVLWLMISIPIGVLSALRPRSMLDRGSMAFVLIGISAHPIWIGLVLSYFIGYKLHITPITGYADFISPPHGEPGGPVQWAYHMILPWTAFSILFAALYARMIRASVLDTMNEDYVRTARAKGAPESRVLRSHILRNAMLPIVTMLGMDIGLALGGAVITEQIFSLPGLGRTAIQALQNFDNPTIMGVVVFATTMVIVFNIIVDLLYAVIDPRIRLA